MNIIQVQTSGSLTELVIDTGHELSSGRTWRAYAKIPCPNPFTAELIARHLRQRLHQATSEIRRQAYLEGLDAGRQESAGG